MKPIQQSFATFARLAATLLILAAVWANGAEAGSGKEDLGTYVFEGVTNKISRVVGANAVDAVLMFEGGGGRRVPLQELPEQLKSKYPYDAAKAAALNKDQTKKNIEGAAAARTGVLDAGVLDQLLRQSNGLRAQIELKEKKSVRLQEEIGNLNRQIRTTPRKHSLRVDKNKLIDEQTDLRRQVDAMRDQLKVIESKIANQN